MCSRSRNTTTATTAYVLIGSTESAKSRTRFSLNSAAARWCSRGVATNRADSSIAAETHHSFCGRLLVFGSLARAPSKECGRCLLTNFALAQFTTWLFWRLRKRLFWRLRNQRHLAFNIFDAVTTHTVAGGYTRPIHTPHITPHSPIAGQSQTRGLLQCTNVKASSAPAACSRTSSGISNVSRSVSTQSLRVSMAHPQCLQQSRRAACKPAALPLAPQTTATSSGVSDR